MNKTSNYKGSVGETFFVAEATYRGFNINVPVSPQSYDYILCNNHRTFKIQVKSNFDRSKIRDVGKYQGNVDVIAVYIDSLRIFYLIPIEFLKTNKHLQIRHPGKSKKFNKYLDNWTIFNHDGKEVETAEYVI